MKRTMLDEETMYRAFMSRDREYNGIFFTGVTTTGIFCNPDCGARKPKRENVVFFETAAEAIRAGFRPCKLCRPLSSPEEEPAEIAKLLEELDADPELRIRDSELSERGLDSGTVRRWFKKHHAMTFQAYQRMLRLNRAIKLLGENGEVASAAFDVGYGSLSGFSSALKKATGRSPSENRTTVPVSVARLKSPLGPMFAACTDRGLCLLEFTDRRMLETEFSILERRVGPLFPGTTDIHRQVQRELDEYFGGERKTFGIPLDPIGSDFQKKVWDVLLTIQYGKTRSYREQALALGDVKWTRAVGHANGRNMISIIIPCHRVIGENGALVGYGGGLIERSGCSIMKDGMPNGRNKSCGGYGTSLLSELSRCHSVFLIKQGIEAAL